MVRPCGRLDCIFRLAIFPDTVFPTKLNRGTLLQDAPKVYVSQVDLPLTAYLQFGNFQAETLVLQPKVPVAV